MVKLNKFLLSFQTFFLLFCHSCEVNRSPIEIEHEPEYQYQYISDNEFLVYRYFFVDTYYRDRYEVGFTDDLFQWSYEEGTLIRELNIFKSAAYSDKDARQGVATIPSRLKEIENVNNISEVRIISGEVEIAEFKRLEEGKDYTYDFARGFFRLKYMIKSADILAVAYRTENDTIGTLQSTINDADTTQFYVLRLIKPMSMRESHEHVWPLMMKNVYFLGDTSFVRDGFNISVRKKDNQNTIQEVDPRKNFSYLLGLDLTDENGYIIDNGDGQVDDNSYLINLQDGELFFPGLHPFNPLPESRFQIADTNRVQLYDRNIPNIRPLVDRDGPSKFEIVVRYMQK